MTGTPRQNATTKVMQHQRDHESDVFQAHDVDVKEDTETVEREPIERERNKLTAFISKNSGVYLPIGLILFGGYVLAQHFYAGVMEQLASNHSDQARLREVVESHEIRLTVLAERADAKSEEIREIKRVLDLVNVKLDDIRARTGATR